MRLLHRQQLTLIFTSPPRHAPGVNRVVTIRFGVPWYYTEIKLDKATRRILHGVRVEEDNINCAQTTLQRAEKHCHSALRERQETILHVNLLHGCIDNHDQGHTLFKITNSFLHRHKTRTLPAPESPACRSTRLLFHRPDT